MGAQYKVNAIATVQSLRRVDTPPYAPVAVSHFGGVFFALANRSDIQTRTDIIGRRLEGADLMSLGAGMAQWHELTEHTNIRRVLARCCTCVTC
jgi:hypothetical protein